MVFSRNDTKCFSFFILLYLKLVLYALEKSMNLI